MPSTFLSDAVSRQSVSPTAVALIAGALDPQHPITGACTIIPAYAP
ncbi:hypothetical protein [Nocardia sp. NPDC052316]